MLPLVQLHLFYGFEVTEHAKVIFSGQVFQSSNSSYDEAETPPACGGETGTKFP